MTKVLLLSKNHMIESNLQNILQRVNAEFYCSSSLFYQAKEQAQVIQYFSLVIVCDTISNVELTQYIKGIKSCGIPIFRMGNKKQINATEFSWLDDDIDYWIEPGDSDSEIIDKIARASFYKPQPGRPSKEEGFTGQNYSNFINRLSKRELQLLVYLYEANGETISRELLCQKMWKTEMSHAGFSNLSAIAKRLKLKMLAAGIDTEGMGSSWGQGYFLQAPFLSFLKNNDFDKHFSAISTHVEAPHEETT
ncbi:MULTISPECIES: winged helix-turn-helix domain-containing protein [Enterococcus]|uniref:Winged helix-turn-helix domain-containing protein n=1 Tax=Candidatus Enterococcus murrayae TaxID=2815321 RepID=A0ABS3HD17_9ENTE|nr:winged helix-turn-helix domain-containing protein [Enterococcus sp. MJM16]MBO0451348.1 winged helix-turn-helix domain-containing protein [Enterococcus sp. MJM16]